MRNRPAARPGRRAALISLAALALSACGGGRTQSGLIRRINPPSASLERLVVAQGAPVRVAVRLQNFSTVPTRFGRVEATVSINGRAAGRLALEAGIEIPGLTSDVVEAELELDAPARGRLAAAREAVPYRLDGAIATTEPEDDYEFTFESRLNPVPGRPGEFR
jgi:hypothetical protein